MIWSTRTRWQISPQAPGKTVFIYFCLLVWMLLTFFLVKLIYSKFDFKNILVYSSMNLSTCIDLCNQHHKQDIENQKKPLSSYNFVVTPLICSPSLYMVRAKSLQSCSTLCDPMECSLLGSSVHGDSPGKNTGLGCHHLLQYFFLICRVI